MSSASNLPTEAPALAPLSSYKGYKDLKKVGDGTLAVKLSMVVDFLKDEFEYRLEFFKECIAHLEFTDFDTFLWYLASERNSYFLKSTVDSLRLPGNRMHHPTMKILLMEIFRPSYSNGDLSKKQEMTREYHRILVTVRPSFAIKHPDVTPFL